MNSSLATLVLFLIAAMFLPQPQAKPQVSCCIHYEIRPFPKEMLKSFENGSPLCPKPAIVFITKMNRRLCADPNLKWVQDRIRDLS
ncbi:C-C motif chemokine 7-like [Thamnophis elegans]|uniref:C-C motif chemokine 7-like n=1 Tax=Thamnophis elegans TaxID=35005 RepID=UPI00137793FC|nr:C-C motif chemokine 7-like [Thamnophis elegans]